MRRLLTICIACLLLPAAAGAQQDARVDAGALYADVTESPFRLLVGGPDGQASLSQRDAIGFRSLGAWYRATRVLTARRTAGGYEATLATTDPLARTIFVRVQPAGAGIVSLHAAVGGSTAGVDAMGLTFANTRTERFFGFGERSNSLDQRGNDVENYVAEGPYQPAEQLAIAAFVPLPGYRPREDSTYFPIPWMLSTRGYGVTIDQDETSNFHLATQDSDSWGLDVAATHLELRFFAGPKPADALRRYSAAVGRQPAPKTAAVFGPWWQPSGDEVANLATLKSAGVPSSVVQTYTHYLPCGDQQGKTAGMRARTARMHDAGLAITTYFNPMICANYRAAFERAEAGGWLTRDPSGQPYTYRYTGSSTFFVGQVDFTTPGGRAFYGDLLDEAVRDGYDGWMEDFGEYTPGDAVGADGSTGEGAHNKYVAAYHAAAHEYSRTRAGKPLLRFNRSGWRETAKDSEIVWGGDPSTGWAFDGLQSALRNGLSMGMSGVSLWGSDIGGFFALSLPQTTPELLIRWLQLGFASGVMRTQASGFDLVPSTRAQIFDKGVLPIWARYARLRTQLYPYLAAAQAEYQRSGMPLMRALALMYPEDDVASGVFDAEMFGPDLLVAPVMNPGQTRRSVHLPRGRWVEFWRSVKLDGGGAPVPSRASVLSGGRRVTVSAPLDEIPMFVKAGAVIPLLGSDVQTLSNYGAGKVVRLADRANRRVLLAFPRSPVIRVRGARTMRYELRASITTLAKRFTPACVEVNGRRLPRNRWRYSRSTGAVRANFRVHNGTVRILRKASCAR